MGFKSESLLNVSHSTNIWFKGTFISNLFLCSVRVFFSSSSVCIFVMSFYHFYIRLTNCHHIQRSVKRNNALRFFFFFLIFISRSIFTRPKRIEITSKANKSDEYYRHSHKFKVFTKNGFAEAKSWPTAAVAENYRHTDAHT